MRTEFIIKALILFLLVVVLQDSCKKDDSESNDNWTPGDNWIDTRDGQSYTTVRIYDQVWMAENLKATQYSDGTVILLVEDNGSWDTMGINDKAYCYYDNDISNGDAYRVLYTWAAAMNGAAGSNTSPSGIQGVCLDSWHLPSDDEWKELTGYLGGYGTAVGQMKETGISHWNSPNTGATNSSGFTALPGGNRFIDGLFHQMDSGAYF